MAKQTTSTPIVRLVNQILERLPQSEESSSSSLPQEQLLQAVNRLPIRLYTPEKGRFNSELPTAYPYDLFPRPSAQPHAGYYPRPLAIMTRSFEGICEDIADSTSLTVADVKAATQALFRQLQLQMQRGVRVEIAPLGIFSTSLTCDNIPTNYNDMPKNLRIGRFLFEPSPELRQAFEGTSFSRRHYYKGMALTHEQRCDNILQYLADQPYITVIIAQQFNRCAYSVASRDLLDLKEQQQVVCTKVGSLKIYSLPK